MRKIALFLAAICLPSAAYAETYDLTVTKVVDGDSIRVAVDWLPPELGTDISIRVMGIDTPEKGGRGQCPAESELGQQATDYAKTKIKVGDVIQVEFLSWDKYGGRIDGNIFIDGESFADMQIAAGLAKPYDGGTKESWCN